MWLYVPNLSTSSPSAQGGPASISASSWQLNALASSAWWRGKPSPSRTWYQRCNKVSWLQLLFGVMPEPSMAEHGVAQWTASLAASRASLTVSPASASVRKTNATSGLRPAVSSSSRARGSSSLRTSAASSRRAEQSASGETFEDWASRLREDCSRRQKSARAMSASGSSSSPYWMTPRAGENDESVEAFQARRMRMDPAERMGVNGTLSIQVKEFQASAWPTPTANDWKGSGPTIERSDGKMRGDRLDYATEQLWTTPSASDGSRGGTITENMSGTKLVQQVNTLWSTSRASDAEKGGPNQSFGAGGVPLPAQTAQWPTPTALSRPRSEETLEKCAAFRKRNANQDTVPLYLEEVAIRASSHPARTNSASGEKPSTDRRSLNPLFVEWLMGWPLGWTLLSAGPELIAFASSATELSLWKHRMRSALLLLGLPRQAPAAQLAFFG
jgi:hypothetical protein